jgi:hypothetical protein
MAPLKEAIIQKKDLQPPKCVFIPGRQLCRKMIRALIKWGNSETSSEFLMRFGLVEDPLV